jgi:hypothetical protein
MGAVAFRIVAQPRAWWPVSFPGVTEEGEVVENRFEMRFMLHGEDEHAQLLARVAMLRDKAETMALEAFGENPTAADVEAKKLTILSALYAETVKEFAVDWRGVGAENGELLKFGDKEVRLLMNMPGVFRATFEAYQSCRLGGMAVREGN